MQSIEQRIQQFLEEESHRPLKQHELARALKVRACDRNSFRKALRNLEREGRIVCLRKNRWSLRQVDHQVLGRLQVHHQGFGFVVPDTPGVQDVFIPEDSLATALHGDHVAVELLRGMTLKPRTLLPRTKAESVVGRIVRVLERHSEKVVGLLRRTPWYSYVIPDDPRLVHTVRVEGFEGLNEEPRENHKVVVRLNPWDKPSLPLTGVVIEDLGEAGAKGVDIVSIIRAFDIDTSFPDDALREARQHSPTPPEEAFAHRRDLRHLLTFTIDPEDAKDFDDAISLTRTLEGHWLLGVHIADVPYYVPRTSATDAEAAERGNSVYLVDRVIPMLPSHLTTDVCSLRPGVDRLTHTASMAMDDEGNVLHAETYRSVIHSSARLTYEQVQMLFDQKIGHGIPPPVQETLLNMRELARTVRGRRMNAGSIDLSVPEVKCILDSEGRTAAIVKRGANEAYQLIEEFMLLANCAVASFLISKEVPGIYRVHEPPDDEQWAKMKMELHALGVEMTTESPRDINRLARRAAATPMAYSVHLAILRNLKRAIYDAEPGEHFGLGFSQYTHFTSPIRRYPDLLVHRILLALEHGDKPPYTYEEVERLAAHCTETEENADEAEQQSVDVKRIEYYRGKFEAGETGPYAAAIVSMTPKGMVVEVSDTLQRGLIPFSSMTDDFYQMKADRSAAVGRRHRKTWQIGQTVEVKIAKVDAARRRVDFFIPIKEPAFKRKRRGKSSETLIE